MIGLKSRFYLAIRLFDLDFYEAIVDEINANYFSTYCVVKLHALTKSHGLNFHRKFAVVYARALVFFLSQEPVDVLFSSSKEFTCPLASVFLQTFRKTK